MDKAALFFFCSLDILYIFVYMISNLPHDTNVPPEDSSSFSHLLHYELRCTDLTQISDINLMIISVTMGPIY